MLPKVDSVLWEVNPILLRKYLKAIAQELRTSLKETPSLEYKMELLTKLLDFSMIFRYQFVKMRSFLNKFTKNPLKKLFRTHISSTIQKFPNAVIQNHFINILKHYFANPEGLVDQRHVVLFVDLLAFQLHEVNLIGPRQVGKDELPLAAPLLLIGQIVEDSVVWNPHRRRYHEILHFNPYLKELLMFCKGETCVEKGQSYRVEDGTFSTSVRL